jgi:hypothetical protein
VRGKADRAGHWSGQGESQGWVEEPGLQLGSILCVGWDMSAQGISSGQNGPAGSQKGNQKGSSGRLCSLNDRFLCLTFLVNSIQPNFNPQNLNY